MLVPQNTAQMKIYVWFQDGDLKYSELWVAATYPWESQRISKFPLVRWSITRLFIYYFNKTLLSTHCMVDTDLEAEDKNMEK